MAERPGQVVGLVLEDGAVQPTCSSSISWIRPSCSSSVARRRTRHIGGPTWTASRRPKGTPRRRRPARCRAARRPDRAGDGGPAVAARTDRRPDPPPRRRSCPRPRLQPQRQADLRCRQAHPRGVTIVIVIASASSRSSSTSTRSRAVTAFRRSAGCPACTIRRGALSFSRRSRIFRVSSSDVHLPHPQPRTPSPPRRPPRRRTLSRHARRTGCDATSQVRAGIHSLKPVRRSTSRESDLDPATYHFTTDRPARTCR